MFSLLLMNISLTKSVAMPPALIKNSFAVRSGGSIVVSSFFLQERKASKTRERKKVFIIVVVCLQENLAHERIQTCKIQI